MGKGTQDLKIKLFIYYCMHKNIMLEIFQFLIFLYNDYNFIKKKFTKKAYMELFLYIITNLNMKISM